MSLVEFPWLERIRNPEIDLSSEVGSIFRSEDHQHSKPSIVDDYLLVAVGKKVKENKSTVIWALRNSGDKKICIFHIHIPAQTIPYARYVSKEELTAFREEERKEMRKALDEYVKLCAKEGVNAHKLYIEAETIENGIVTLISENMIENLVMGAAADNNYTKNMPLTSKKAIYVKSHAPTFCHISFICKGQVIYTRKGVKRVYPNQESNGETKSLRFLSRSETELSDNKSDVYQGENTSTPICLTPSMSNASSFENEHAPRTSVSDSTRPSSSSGVVKEESILLTTPPIDEEYAMGDELYNQYNKLIEEVKSLRDKAYLESIERRRAEKETFESIRKAEATESLYFEEQKLRIEVEEKLVKELNETNEAIRKAEAMEGLYYEEEKRRKELEEKRVMELEDLASIKNQHDKVVEELRIVLLEKSSLESEIEKSNFMVEELNEKVLLLETYKKERDNALLEIELLKRQLAQFDPATQVSRFFADFTYAEIREATNNFNQSRKIGEGGFGDTYKGLLRHAEVAIKVLSSDSLQGPQEFQHEVDALSKLRHPNIVTLIGVCSEASALIYEYLPNGNLDDRLACKDNTQPLSWQTRIRIATELCSALMLLHSCKPESIIHGDLKPANVLLDASLSCKLSDFGICRKIENGEQSMDDVTKVYKTDPKGTFAYIDPEFLSSGELTPKSDIYSFGIILLRLLTGKPALGIIREVQNALEKDNLNTILDPSAGDWPFVQAKQFALLALRCCDMHRKNRPELRKNVWRVLKSMRVSAGSSSSANPGQDEYDHVPSYFMCPISQEVMQDPHIAADGFTYEAEAIKGWLDSGHDTSPMTNLKLENHTLIPNRGLRSAIQEWLQHRLLT